MVARERRNVSRMASTPSPRWNRSRAARSAARRPPISSAAGVLVLEVDVERGLCDAGLARDGAGGESPDTPLAQKPGAGVDQPTPCQQLPLLPRQRACHG